jgi:hypothetical protein
LLYRGYKPQVVNVECKDDDVLANVMHISG